MSDSEKKTTTTMPVSILGKRARSSSAELHSSSPSVVPDAEHGKKPTPKRVHFKPWPTIHRFPYYPDERGIDKETQERNQRNEMWLLGKLHESGFQPDSETLQIIEEEGWEERMKGYMDAHALAESVVDGDPSELNGLAGKILKRRLEKERKEGEKKQKQKEEKQKKEEMWRQRFEKYQCQRYIKTVVNNLMDDEEYEADVE